MTDYARLNAIQFKAAMDHASTPELLDALKEIDRLQKICRHIVDLINVDPFLTRSLEDALNTIEKIEETAQEYYLP